MKPRINCLIYHTDNDSFGLSPPLPPHTDFSLWAVTASTSSHRLLSLSCHCLYLLIQTSFFELSLPLFEQSPPLPPHTDFSLWAVTSSLLLTQTSLFELSPPHTDFSLWVVTSSTSSHRLLYPVSRRRIGAKPLPPS